MNLERLEVLARWLEAGGERSEDHPYAFDMMVLIDPAMEGGDCGSVCCIAGSAVLRWPTAAENEANVLDGRVALQSIGAAILWLDEARSKDLFNPAVYFRGNNHVYDNNPTPPKGWPDYNGDVTPAWAARTIRHLMKTGEVAWHKTREEA